MRFISMTLTVLLKVLETDDTLILLKLSLLIVQQRNQNGVEEETLVMGRILSQMMPLIRRKDEDK